MTTLRLAAGRELKYRRQRSVYFSPLRVYLDRGYNSRLGDDGKPLRVKEPPMVQRVMLTVAMHKKLQREKILTPELQPTHRTFLRWGESGGNGLPNPEAEIRETHYDPLPPEIQEKVDDIVFGSPWEMLVRKWYRTSKTNQELADELGVKRTQLYTNWNSALWYYRGRFETERVYA